MNENEVQQILDQIAQIRADHTVTRGWLVELRREHGELAIKVNGMGPLLETNTTICSNIKETLDKDIKKKLDLVYPNFATINQMANEYVQRAAAREWIGRFFATGKRAAITITAFMVCISSFVAGWQWLLSHIK